MSKKKRIIAIIAIFSLFLTMILSTLFIAQNSYHRCCGRDCTVCLNLQSVTKGLSQNKIEPNSIGAAILAALTYFVILSIGTAKGKTEKTLIDLHIKLTV